MKRCPECGYRVRAQELKRCPLCGGRMISDSDGKPAVMQTHVHEREQECLLPNKSEQEAAQGRQPVKKQAESKSWTVRSRRSGGKNSPAAIVVVLILYVLLRSCGA